MAIRITSESNPALHSKLKARLNLAAGSTQTSVILGSVAYRILWPTDEPIFIQPSLDDGLNPLYANDSFSQLTTTTEEKDAEAETVPPKRRGQANNRKSAEGK